MSDEEQPKYTLTLKDGTVRHRSRDYTGNGQAVYENGELYDGDYVDGIRIGRGEYKYANGDLYEGQFDENRKNGMGKLIYSGKPQNNDDSGEAPVVVIGGSYHGFFNDGKKQGKGTFRYSNGDVYSGSWEKGLKHGSGTYLYSSDGSKLMGFWDRGSFTRGKWVLTSGAFFEGEFKYNKPVGEGVWNLGSNVTVPGVYVQHLTFAEEEGQAPAETEEGVPKIERIPTQVTIEWVSSIKK